MQLQFRCKLIAGRLANGVENLMKNEINNIAAYAKNGFLPNDKQPPSFGIG